tara:strand:+ start:787 stop:1284 length:498 start_codon:yes stop_codon:yes gene_type:complete
MSYTFTEVQTFPIDDDFDSIYADSLSDIEGGTVKFKSDTTDTEKRNRIIQLMNEQNYDNMKNVIVTKDDTPCLYIQGYYQDNTYTWANVLVGRVNDSKAWTWTNAFHQANKEWIQSLGGTKFALECIKYSRIETYFTQATESGICLGTLTSTPLDDGMIRMSWEY